MNKIIPTLFACLSTLASAHPGHPGPEAHGDPTHLVVGLIAALPLLGILWLALRRWNASKVVSRTRTDKENPHG